jgi:hypothetical protein
MCLNIIKTIVNHTLIAEYPTKIQCGLEGMGWCFTSCWLTTPIYMTHVLTTMQTAAIVRAVFIKTTKKATMEETKAELKAFGKELYHMTWVKEDAHDNHEEDHEEFKVIKAKLEKEKSSRSAV